MKKQADPPEVGPEQDIKGKHTTVGVWHHDPAMAKKLLRAQELVRASHPTSSEKLDAKRRVR